MEDLVAHGEHFTLLKLLSRQFNFLGGISQQLFLAEPQEVLVHRQRNRKSSVSSQE